MNTLEKTVDLNADLGEGFPNDDALLCLVTSTSVACGAHAGDSMTLVRALRGAKARGVVVGAHPGFPDRETFGRAEREVTTADVERIVNDQLSEFEGVARAVGVEPRFVKPHGALYNQAQRDLDVAVGVVNAVRPRGLALLGQPGSVIEDVARSAGVRFITEGFPDRRYNEDGSLMPRSSPDSVLTHPLEIEAQVIRLVEQGVETLCIHGDDPRAIENAGCVRAVLERHDIAMRGFA